MMFWVVNKYTNMNYQSHKQKTERRDRNMIKSSEVRRRSAFDRHIRKLDTDRLKIKETSPSISSKSSSSYRSQLEESLFKRKGIRQYTIQKRQKKEQKQVVVRKVVRSSIPIRRFKVSGWIDNYYSNLLDWSYNNFICAANNQHLYFYNMAMDDQLENALYRQYTVRNCHEKINSIHFSPIHTKIALGYNEGSFVFYDYFKQKSCNPLRQHSLRISIIQWQNNLIFTGSKDKKIKCLDSRTLKKAISLANVHTQQVCGLKAHCHYLASGGNDNNVYVYDIRKPERQLDHYRHDAAVKALDWIIPNVLVSGGGTVDRRINYWKDGEGIIKTIDTGSQVCGLIASINSDEVVSCQGFSLNQIIIWDMHGNRALTVHGHQSRVLYSVLSPGGRFVATGAGDQMLHIWNLFESSKQEWPATDMR